MALAVFRDSFGQTYLYQALEIYDELVPIHHLRKLTGIERTQSANRELAFILAFVAGATNTGGYIATRQFTSHMSGTVSSLAEKLAFENGWVSLS